MRRNELVLWLCWPRANPILEEVGIREADVKKKTDRHEKKDPVV